MSKIVKEYFRKSGWKHFLDGFKSAFNLFPPSIELPKISDAEAIAKDWEAVLGDLEKAWKRLDEKYRK